MLTNDSILVRVRPFSEKERAQLSSEYTPPPTLFSSDTTATPSNFNTPQPSRNSPGTGLRKVLKVLDDRILVFDPPESNKLTSFTKGLIPALGKKVKDIRFCFDRVFDDNCGQEEVYEGSAKSLVGHVMDGFHSTVFAYGVSFILRRF